MSAKKQCCTPDPGEPAALHSLDCPDYLAFHEWLRRGRIEAAGTEAANPPLMPGAESTSAAQERDREYERAQILAAVLDLTRRDRDTARHDADMARNNREHLNRLLTRTRDELAAARQERDALIGERSLFARSSWVVARDGGRDCVRCDREIRRGEAYELLPGVDNLQHVLCPTHPEGETDG